MKRLGRRALPLLLGSLTCILAACGDDATAPETPPPTFARVMGTPGLYTFAGDIMSTSSGLRVALGQFSEVLHIGSSDSLIEVGDHGEGDAFAVAYRENGSVAWKRAIGGDGSEGASCGARDGNDNMFIGGFYNGATTIAGSVLSNHGAGDALVVKLSSNGTPQWAVGSGANTGSDLVRDISVTLDGDPVVCGIASDAFAMAGKTLGEAGRPSGFVLRVSTLGGGVWASTATTGTGGSDCWGITRGSDGSLFVCGEFFGTVTVAGSVLPSDGEYDGFIARFSDTGTGMAAHQIGGGGSAQLRSIVAMGSGYVATGSISGANDFDLFSAAGAVTAVGLHDVVVARWSQPGVLQWVKQFGGAGDEYGWRIARLGDHTLITGTFASTITFGSHTLSTNGGDDVFLAELDANGNAVWAGAIGSAADDTPGGVLGVDSRALVLGMIEGDTRFPDGQTKNAIGTRDVFTYQR